MRGGMRGKGGRFRGPTNLLPSCADYLEIWEPHSPGNCRVLPGLYRDFFTSDFSMSSSHLFDLPSGHMPRSFAIKILYAFPISPILSSCSASDIPLSIFLSLNVTQMTAACSDIGCVLTEHIVLQLNVVKASKSIVLTVYHSLWVSENGSAFKRREVTRGKKQ